MAKLSLGLGKSVEEFIEEKMSQEKRRKMEELEAARLRAREEEDKETGRKMTRRGGDKESGRKEEGKKTPRFKTKYKIIVRRKTEIVSRKPSAGSRGTEIVSRQT